MKPKGSLNNNSSSNKKDFRRDFRNNRRRGNFSREKEKEKPEENTIVYNCEICSEVIQDISSALAMPGSGNPAHFDCVLKKITGDEKLEEGQQVVYLGGGNFGIIKTDSKGSRNTFQIIKKIEYEERDKTPEWRKLLVRVKV